MNLKDIRDDIDRIDAKMLALLDERMEKALLARAFKSSVTDPARESAVLDRITRSSRCLAGPDFTSGLWKSIMAEARAIQDRKPKTVGFQGEHGANSEVALRAWDADAAAMPCVEFSDVFDSVRDGLFDYGIVPVENTLGGLVGPVNSILINTDLKIVAAIDAPISHCLLAVPGADHREIRSAYSHPQALAQCRNFLARNKLEARAYYDTAGAARMISQERRKDTAAIANRFAAEIYDLEIIKDEIQDAQNNRTRFLVIAKEASAQAGNKCSAVFSTNDKAGALFGILEIFAREGINLTRIESVPDKPGDYAIFIDFDGSDSDPAVAKAIEGAKAEARGFRILGCYAERKL
jgi:prephenate dehydratase/chorismate mutase/prephenate dehydratase